MMPQNGLARQCPCLPIIPLLRQSLETVLQVPNILQLSMSASPSGYRILSPLGLDELGLRRGNGCSRLIGQLILIVAKRMRPRSLPSEQHGDFLSRGGRWSLVRSGLRGGIDGHQTFWYNVPAHASRGHGPSTGR